MTAMGWFSRLLGKLARVSAQNPKVVLALALLLCGVSFFLVTRLQINTKVSALLPKDLPAMKEQRELIRDLGRGNWLIVLVEPPPDAPFSQYRNFIRRYKKGLEELSATREKGTPLSKGTMKEMGGYLSDHGLFLLDPADLPVLNERLSPEAMKERLSKRGFLGGIPFSKRFDPLGLLGFLMELILPSKKIVPDNSGDFFITKDKKHIFFIIGTEASPGNVKRTKKLLADAKKIEEAVWEKIQSKSKIALEPPKITWIGTHTILLDDKEVLDKALLINLVSSLLGTILLFYVFFRGVRPLFFTYLPLGMGILWTFALAQLSFGELNILTISIGGMLLGIGMDFPTYLLNRYYQRREEGEDLMDALENTWAETGRSVFFGAMTTCSAFFLMTLIHLQAFRELGFLAGAGLLLTLIAVFTVLPAILALGEGKIVLRRIRKYPHRLIRIPLQKTAWTLMGCLALFVFFGGLLFQFRLESPLQELYRSAHARDSLSMKAFQELSQILETTLLPIPLVVEGENLEQALELNDRLTLLLMRYRKEGKVAFIDTLSHWLPSEARQKQSLAILETLPNLDAKQFSKNYTDALPVMRFPGLTAYGKYRKAVERVLSSRETTDRTKMSAAGLGDILNNYLKETGSRFHVTSYIYLPVTEDYPAAKETLLKELTKEEMFQKGEVNYPSEEKVLREIRDLLRKDFILIGALASGAILILLLVCFRSVTLTLIGITPVVLGGVAALGSYGFIFGPMSIVNFLWMPIYFGLCLDDNIHIASGLRQDGGDLYGTLRNTGGAICFTSLTNMVGVGSMAVEPFPMLQQAGLFIVLALGWELVASLFFLPALLKLWQRKKIS